MLMGAVVIEDDVQFEVGQVRLEASRWLSEAQDL
jgi:hypothetical protein